MWGEPVTVSFLGYMVSFFQNDFFHLFCDIWLSLLCFSSIAPDYTLIHSCIQYFTHSFIHCCWQALIKPVIWAKPIWYLEHSVATWDTDWGWLLHHFIVLPSACPARLLALASSVAWWCVAEPLVFYWPHRARAVELCNPTSRFWDDLSFYLCNGLQFTSGFHVTRAHWKQKLFCRCYTLFCVWGNRLWGLQLSDSLKATALVGHRSRIQLWFSQLQTVCLLMPDHWSGWLAVFKYWSFVDTICVFCLVWNI